MHEATLQQHSTERACPDDVYFLNEDLFTKHFGDHWGGSVEDKKKVKKKTNVVITSKTWRSRPRLSRKRNVEQCTDIELYPTNTYQKKNNGAHWSTFCHFGSYEEAHTHKPFASRQMAAQGNILQEKKQKAAESRT